MRDKKQIFFLCVFWVLILMSLSGCSKSGKSEKEIINDLQADPVFISADVEISDYKIIKRQTDVENKTDFVYITVHTNAPELTSSLTYELKYELYNEGWILESVMRYYDGPWEFSGLSNEQLLADVKDNDYYFSDWDLDVEDFEIVEETCDSNAMVYYEKWITIDLAAHHTSFDYHSSYKMCYGIVDGIWQLQSAEIQNRRYAPTYSAGTGNVMETLDMNLQNLYLLDGVSYQYDNYQYLRTDSDWDNCFEIQYYTAEKTWFYGKETFLISIPVHFSIEDGYPHWYYNEDEIGQTLQSVEWGIIGTKWTSDMATLEIHDISATDDPNVYSANVSCNARYISYVYANGLLYHCEAANKLATLSYKEGHWSLQIPDNTESIDWTDTWCGNFYLHGYDEKPEALWPEQKAGLFWFIARYNSSKLEKVS
ncbi:hypothetical protein D1641_15230 [Colidextribacter sp. OB.20]|uniref:hypothetical protein n=1 Tax=Colidextribacter sp. OB.20 TaxID=2304568 RepID=UPI001368A224|nr:hypothetical protein [Colidextribacter sp. OB.20]NBI11347.1 hypothetical protein [Colidextribacter sp. OB.20]